MKCELCSDNDAIIHIQQIMGNDKIDFHLCEECAKKKGITKGGQKLELSLPELLTGLVDLKDIVGGQGGESKTCPNCGISREEFKKTGKLGCAGCYNAFNKDIVRMLRKLSGASRHKGKYPSRLKSYKSFLIDREILKQKLEDAVKREDYEAAAAIRDRILKLEQGSLEKSVPAGAALEKTPGEDNAAIHDS
ncbi:MAG: DNA helicase UvrBC [Spirochaetales bacterium]|nr:MAG: DNA helicase UvrBC [Spirochaetales bacterium]